MAGNTEVQLVAGQVFEMEDPDTPDAWLVLNGVTSGGAIGKQSEKKDRTTVSDTQKVYGAALPDAEDKTFKIQYLSGDEDQKKFVDAAKAYKQIKIRSTWPDKGEGGVSGTVAEMEVQLLGFVIDEGSAEDWIMGTVTGSQNSIAWTDPA